MVNLHGDVSHTWGVDDGLERQPTTLTNQLTILGLKRLKG